MASFDTAPDIDSKNNDDDESRFNEGVVVELHSLSATALNGRLGAISGKFDAEKGRYPVQLFNDEKKRVAVRPSNLKSPAPIPENVAKQAEELLHNAHNNLKEIRMGRPESSLSRVLEILDKSIALNPTAWLAHHVRGDAAYMMRDLRAAIMHFRRALENGGSIQSRLSLAGILGEAGDRAGEKEQLQLCAQEQPDHIMVKSQIAMILKEDGELEKALQAFISVLQSPNLPQFCTMQPHFMEQFGSAAGATARNIIYQFPNGCPDGTFTSADMKFEAVTAPSRVRDLELGIQMFNLLLSHGNQQEVENTHRSNLAFALCGLGKFDEAEQVAQQVLTDSSVHPQCKSFALHTLATCAEARADMQIAQMGVVEGSLPEAVADLYAQAKQKYLESFEANPDEAARKGFARAQAKSEPAVWQIGSVEGTDLFYIQNISGQTGMSLKILGADGFVMEVEPDAEDDGYLPGYKPRPE